MFMVTRVNEYVVNDKIKHIDVKTDMSKYSEQKMQI